MQIETYHGEGATSHVEDTGTVHGFSLWFDREAWGHIVDGLILERERSTERKAANTESNSNNTADRCAEIIGRITRGAA